MIAQLVQELVPAQQLVLALAQDNDRLGVLKATRDKIAEKLDKGAGNRDTALLTREMTEIMFREKADNVSYVDHEARVFQDVVLGGPAQLRKIFEALEAERTSNHTCSEDRVLGVRGSRYTRVHVHQQRRGG